MTDPRKTTEDIFGEFGFRLNWSTQEYWADVTVHEAADNDVPGAEPYLQGYVKWDGCTELDMGRPHWCGPEHVQKHCDLLKYVYCRAFELMGCDIPKALTADD